MSRLYSIEKGQSLIEYVLILSLVLLVGVTAIGGVGEGVRDRAEGVADYMVGGGLGGGASNVGEDSGEDEREIDEKVKDAGVVLEPLEDYFKFDLADTENKNSSDGGNNLVFVRMKYDFDDEVCDLNIPAKVYIDKSNGKHYREVKDEKYGNDGVYYLKSNNGYEEVNVLGHDVESLQWFMRHITIPSTVKKIKISVDEDNSIVDLSHFIYGVKGKSYNQDVVLDLSDFKGVKPIWMEETFAESSAFKEIDLSTLDTSDTISMRGLFRGCARLGLVTYGDGFDTRNVKNMRRMFYYTRIEEIDLSKFDTRNVENMSEMFASMIRLKSINFGDNFDTSNVTDMSGMFDECRVLEYLDLSSFDTYKVTDMSKMFADTKGLKSLDLSGFDTGNVTNMSGMFIGSGLKGLDLSGFNTSNVTDMSDMFKGCLDLEYLNISNFETSKVTDMGGMFYTTSRLHGPVFGDFKIHSEDVYTGSITYNAHKEVRDAVNKAKQW